MLKPLFFAGLLLWTQSFAALGAPVILVLGDSLSAGYGLDLEQGWVFLLGRRLAEGGWPHQVVNAGVSGDTTAGGLTRLPDLLERHRPSLVIIELGANDGLRGFGFAQTEENLTALVGLAKQAGSQVLLVGTRLPPNYGAAYTDGFQAIYPRVAKAAGVPLVPRLLAGVADDRSLMQADGLHPTAAAQELVLDNVWPLLEPMLGPATADRGH